MSQHRECQVVGLHCQKFQSRNKWSKQFSKAASSPLVVQDGNPLLIQQRFWGPKSLHPIQDVDPLSHFEGR